MAKAAEPTEAQTNTAAALNKIAAEIGKVKEPWAAMAEHRTRLTAQKILKGTTAEPASKATRSRDGKKSTKVVKKAPQGAPRSAAASS